MHPNEYKRYYLDFLVAAYPDGLPLDFTELVFSVGDLEFVFPVDLNDYNKHLEMTEMVVPIRKATKKAPKVKNANKTKKRVTKPKKTFDSMLSAQDIQFLSGLKISLND